MQAVFLAKSTPDDFVKFVLSQTVILMIVKLFRRLLEPLGYCRLAVLLREPTF